MLWKDPIGWPNALRCFMYSSVRGAPPRARRDRGAAIDSRSCGRFETS